MVYSEREFYISWFHRLFCIAVCMGFFLDVISDDCHHSSPCDDQQDPNFLPHEGEPDFYETNCHWDSCRAEFETQDELVRVGVQFVHNLVAV